MKDSYRIDEAAKQLGVSRRTLERAIERGELETYKIFGSRRIDAKELAKIKKKEQSEAA